MGVSQQLEWSNPVTKSPFGNLPFGIAGGMRAGFSGPLGRGFGYGGGKKSPYGAGEGPLGTFISQAAPMTREYLPGQVNLSTELMRNTRSTYGGYQQAIDQFMQQLPGFQHTANQATGYASTAAEDAFSPLPGRATFQEASRRAISAARPGEAARGMVESGQGQAGEQGIVSDLAFQALQNENATRQAAISGLTGANQNQAAIASMGPQMRGAGMEGAGQFAQMLSQQSGIPMEAMNNMLGFLTSTQNPNMALLRMVLPTVQNKSFGGGGKV